MRAIHEQIKQLDGAIVVVSFASPTQIAAFLSEYPLPFPMVADPERRAYHAFGLTQMSRTGFLRPGVIWRYLKLIFRGWLPGLPDKNADVLQLGGDFILDPAGNVTFAYPSADAADRPSNEKLLSEVRKAAGRASQTQSMT